MAHHACWRAPATGNRGRTATTWPSSEPTTHAPRTLSGLVTEDWRTGAVFGVSLPRTRAARSRAPSSLHHHCNPATGAASLPAVANPHNAVFQHMHESTLLRQEN